MLNKIQQDLQYRKEVLAPKIAAEYKAAIDDGDGAHDNPGIRDKGQEMEDNLREIHRLENLLRVKSKSHINSKPENGINIGSEIKLLDIASNVEKIVKLVTSEDMEYVNNGVSIGSPLGQVLLHKKEGELIDLNLPTGVVKKYKILNVKNENSLRNKI